MIAFNDPMGRWVVSVKDLYTTKWSLTPILCVGMMSDVGAGVADILIPPQEPDHAIVELFNNARGHDGHRQFQRS
jgi:hypothetical protein